ncbi:unnamed protein product [Vicia faba]|uniref:Reverse transcriptase n=1 Tax=Vicia faba TaxID=3906 RepID=A0AAV1B4X5_VICFA|nr:unnamed protein product [Vicia faba]
MSWDKLARSKGDGGMGFRGISEFNTSLLGKQYWCLLKGDDSLMDKVFKWRYYPRCSIYESHVGYAPNYAWQSILSARDLVKKGARWRIGNGKKVKILNDCWLPNNPGFKFIGSTRGFEVDSKVSDLVDKYLCYWKKDLIRNRFDHAEANNICSIPLSARNQTHALIWNFERDGDYSEYNLKNLDVLAKKGSPVTLVLESIPSEITIIQVDVRIFPNGSVAFGCVFKNSASCISFMDSKKELLMVPPVLDEILAIRWFPNVEIDLKMLVSLGISLGLKLGLRVIRLRSLV